MKLIIMRTDGELTKFQSIVEDSDIQLVVVDDIPADIRTLPCIVNERNIVQAVGRKACYQYLIEN